MGSALQGKRSYLAYMLLLVVASLLAMLVPSPSFAADDANSTPEYTSWDDLAGATVGMVTGATFESALREKCPEVGDVVYYSSTSDLIVALQGHKIDAMVNSTAVGILAANRYGASRSFPRLWVNSSILSGQKPMTSSSVCVVGSGSLPIRQ